MSALGAHRANTAISRDFGSKKNVFRMFSSPSNRSYAVKCNFCGTKSRAGLLVIGVDV